MNGIFVKRSWRLALAVVLALIAVVFTACAVLFRERSFLGDASLDEKTSVGPSRIPGAGLGLFAARDLDRGELIAEMGGRLILERLIKLADRGYLFTVPDCAKADVWPYDALDGRELGGHGSKINFAPRTINGQATGLQNAEGRFMCRRPYVYFRTTRPIPKGTEILASYGPEYDYDFMGFPAVRAHFCREAGIDCTTQFTFEP